MFYARANFDEDVFDDPHTLRHPARPQPARRAFGGHGAHYCIGANLARIDQPDLQRDRRPHARSVPGRHAGRLRSGWLNGIKHWQVDYTGSTSS